MTAGNPPPPDDAGAGAAGAAWQATFADLAALLLSFFVLVFSMSAVEEQRWATLSAGLAERPNPGGKVPPPLRPLMAPREDAAAVTSADYLYALLRGRLGRAPLLVPVTLVRTPDAVVVRFDARLLLRGGRPAPTAQGRLLVERLVDLLAPLDNAVDLRLQWSPPTPDPGRDDQAVVRLRAAAATAGLLRAAGFDRPLAAYASRPAPSLGPAAAAEMIEVVVHEYPARG